MSPRVSIIIPNFDNGRSSSRSGRDLASQLFESLERTLVGENVSFEIVVADDGSSDDSLATCRQWARRRLPDGRPFLRLIELPHSGVLSRVLNVLERESQGEFLARLDGDIVLRTDRWLTPLVAMFDVDERLGVVTATQLLPDGTVHAFGDDLWGPRGYRHIAHGARLDELPPEREVDHAMGCFYMTRRAVHASVGGYDEEMLRGQTEEYGVRVRLGGWKVKVTSRVAFEHWHVDRLPRANRADRPAALDESLEHFRERWGFDRLAPDLEEVRRRYAGTPLWWRDLTERECEAPADEWTRLASDRVLSTRLREELDFIAPDIVSGRLVTQFGSGCGTLGVSLARAGVAFEGFERPGPAHSAALSMTGAVAKAFPAGPPIFSACDRFPHTGLPAESRPLVALLGVLERSWNPVGILREARRVVSGEGTILVRTELRAALLDDIDERGCRFTAEEFLAFLRHVGGLATVGPAPRIVRSDSSAEGGWLECRLRATPIDVGRGYFSRPVAAAGSEPVRS
ncbi:MAG: glycosyltransferase [Phycisphaerae bacterium]|jgi:GT2 family glycosyltransferase|nr:glycosyltransferase [Phycisphaerae bacterium]